MIRIILCCSGGISTSFLEQNIKKALVAQGIEGKVFARSEREVHNFINDFDVLLLAPQARFAEEHLRKVCAENNKAFALIDAMVYGRMDGNGALDIALKACEKKGGS